MKRVTAPVTKCVCLNVPALVSRNPQGVVTEPRAVRWNVNRELGRLELWHDAKGYAMALTGWGGFGALAVNCPTCGARCYKLWLAPDRYCFQCRLCARVATWHAVRDRNLKLDEVGVLAQRIKRLRARYSPVASNRTTRWYRGIAKIIALEDRLCELASTVEIGD